MSTQPTISEPPPNTSEAGASDAEIHTLVTSFEEYDFGSDTDFRAGLPAVIRSFKGKGSSAAEIDDIIAKAQWFYFTRKNGSSIPFDTYLRYRTGETESIPMRRPSIAPVVADLGLGGERATVSGGVGTASESASTGVGVTGPARRESQEGISVTSPEVSTHPLPDEAPSYDDVPRTVGDRVAAAEMGGDVVIGAGVGSGSGGGTEITQTEVVETVAPGPEQSIPFDDVVRLIASGRAGEIPTTQVPEGLNTAPASESVMAARAKPWEQSA